MILIWFWYTWSNGPILKWCSWCKTRETQQQQHRNRLFKFIKKVLTGFFGKRWNEQFGPWVPIFACIKLENRSYIIYVIHLDERNWNFRMRNISEWMTTLSCTVNNVRKLIKVFPKININIRKKSCKYSQLWIRLINQYWTRNGQDYLEKNTADINYN